VAASAVGLLDPALPAAALAGPPLAAAGFALASRHGRPGPRAAFLLTLGCTFSLIAWCRPDFGGDSPSYYVYLRSLAFDHDLDFTNEWQAWGYKERPLTATGLRSNIAPVGAACLWSPFFVAAHVYVVLNRLVGRMAYAADGFSLPYLRSAALGTATYAIAGAFLLIRSLSKRWDGRLAVLAVAGTTLASPVPYYLFVQPAMAHGLVFALACAFVATWLAALDAPDLRSWVVLGALLGLMALTRWQCAVYALMLLPLLGVSAEPRRWAAAAGAALVAFAAQLAAWAVLFGSPFAAPQREHGMDWSSPHLAGVLLSADRGLFSWTPAMALGAIGLLALPRRLRGFAIAALAVLVASAWVNGGVREWTASDAFGARRFDLAVPLLAVGMLAAIEAATRVVARRPWLPATALLALAAAWNFGLMRLYRIRVFSEAAPLETVAARQVHQLRNATEAAFLRWGGPRLRNLAYDFFVGEYFYWNVNLNGAIDVGAIDNRFLGDGWSPPQRRPGWPAFRWAFHPRACVMVPLPQPALLRSFLRARAPEGLANQTVTVSANGRVVAVRTLPAEWTDVPFEVPASAVRVGPNSLCFEFAHGTGPDDQRPAAAAVSLVQLP
jgi:hypothetical protein